MKGIDLSSHNGTINFEKLYKDDIRFLISRLSYGGTHDKSKLKYLPAAKQNDITDLGGYHYVNLTDPKKQTDAFLSAIKTLEDNLSQEIVIALDCEDPPAEKYPVKLYKDIIIKVYNDLKEKLQKPIFIYGATHYLQGLDLPSEFAKEPLWLANWRTTVPKTAPAPWTSITVWQHGIADGIDRNIFYGGEEDWNRFAKSEKISILDSVLGQVLIISDLAAGRVPGQGPEAFQSCDSINSANTDNGTD